MSRHVEPARSARADRPRPHRAIVGAVQRPDGRWPSRCIARGSRPESRRVARRVDDALGDFHVPARAARRRAPSCRRSATSRRRRIAARQHLHDVVVADDGPTAAACAEGLVPAIAGLYVPATAAQRHCDLTLLTAFDLDRPADDAPAARTMEEACCALRWRARDLSLQRGCRIGSGSRVETAWRALLRLEGPHAAFGQRGRCCPGPPRPPGAGN